MEQQPAARGLSSRRLCSPPPTPRLLLLLIVIIVAAWWLTPTGASDADAALVLTSQDFEAAVSRHRVILVFFYAPWCGYCKKLHPEFDKAAAVLSQLSPPVPMGKINCDSNKKTCSNYGATSYPKLKLFRYGALVQDYSGTRDTASLVRLMTLKAGPSFTVLSSEQDLSNFHRSNEHSIVGFFESNESNMARHFKELSEYLVEKHRFAQTTSLEIMGRSAERIVVYRPSRLASDYEPSEIETSTDRDLQGLLAWTADVMHGMCGHRYPSNVDEFRKRPLVVVYYDVNFETNRTSTLLYRNRILEAAKQLQGSGFNAHFAFSNAKDFRKELDTFGLEPSAGGKFAVAARNQQESKFATSGIDTTQELVDFVMAFLNGMVPQYIMSEPAQEESEEDMVKVVVGTTFESIVLDPTKDVLLEVFAPWCGNCRRLAPIYWQLGEAMASEPDIVIAKMNGATNDSPHPSYRTTKYPAIFFALKGSKDRPKLYHLAPFSVRQGPRTLQSLVQFVAAEASSELNTLSRSGSPRTPGWEREL